MTSSTSAAASVVCVSVATPRGRVDLALPSGVAVAEIAQELVARLDLSSPMELRDVVGERLLPDEAIGTSVRDGAVLQLIPRSAPGPEWFFDDPSEALTNGRLGALRTDRTTWSEGALVGSCGVALIAALAGILLLPAGPPVVLAAGVVSIVLLVAGLSAASRAGAWPIMLVWCASAYAAGAAYLATGRLDSPWLPVAGLAAIGCALVGLDKTQAWVLPVAGVASGWLLLLLLMSTVRVLSRSTGTTWIGPVDAATTAAMLVVGLVLMALPRLALAVSGLSHPMADSGEVLQSAGRGEQALTLGLLSAGLVHVLAVPWAVGLGLPGALLAAVVSMCFLLLARTMPSASAIGMSLGAGAVSLALALGVALATQPTWRPALVVLFLVLAAGLAMGAGSFGRSEVRVAMLTDRAEWLARASLLPLAVWSLGLVPWASRVGTS